MDTGVDIEHPDLAANVWTNAAEAAGIAGQDDDANGFKDDIHGWDFINNHSVTNDFNGHGTHCAGIAAAVGNNGIGITGANPDALIMPVTVMQSNGTGDVATIVKGIDYAAANGADVISMSIGSYSYSLAEEQALGRAYANAVLIAAAGNDGHAMVPPTHCLGDAPMFPAAFTFVLGVEASQDQTCLASFSNYDPDGPIYSSFEEDKLYNYELRAPGYKILSTFPGGRYKLLNGTSMACPLVAGAISRLIQCKEILSNELLFGDLIHTHQPGTQGPWCSMESPNGNIDILAAYNITDAERHPELALVSANLIDTASGDGDMRADAGETIEFYPIFKNAWGQAENVRFWIKAGFDNQGDWVWDDTTLIHSLQDTAYFGKPLSSYAKATSLNPFRMTVSPNCADGRKINMTFFAICDNAADTLRQTVTIEVENGVEIGGIITEDMTLYPDVHYIINKNTAIASGVKLTIKPGTTIYLKGGALECAGATAGIKKDTTLLGISGRLDGPDLNTVGQIIAQGKPDSMIVLVAPTAGASLGQYLYYTYSFRRSGSSTSGMDSLIVFSDVLNFWEYVHFEGSWQLTNLVLKNCICDDATFSSNGGTAILHTCNVSGRGIMPGNNSFIYHTNACNLRYKTYIGDLNIGDYNDNGRYSLKVPNNVFPVENRDEIVIKKFSGSVGSIQYLPANYYGMSTQKEIRKYIQDIETGYGMGSVSAEHILTQPVKEAHGIVWKILVDGFDAQDEFELLPPIGVGQHKCDVYFNRPMDVSIAPTISFGVRQPYTQHQVAENGSWSADSTIYTAYFTIDGKSVTDGLNTFKVYGAEDNEHFEIPEESWRFHMEVAAAGSMSTGLMAEAGLGKVTLTWETDEEDFADLLGYNIYRWTTDTIKWDRHKENGVWVEAGWRFDTICINSSLIDSEETQFIDYDVIPGKDYYYVIRQVTTSLNTYDLSNPVVARPLTAIKGDANGSMSVDVADVITEVNYITHQNPQPFIFEAADVNSDGQVNVIDVVATVNLILHPGTQSQAINSEPAYYYIENGILYVETDVVLGGVQCNFTAEQGHTFTVLDALNGFETVSNWQTETDYLFMAYSMSGKTLEIGKHALLQIGDAELTNIVLSDAQGHNVVASPRASTALDGTLFMPCSTKYIQDNSLYIKIGDRIYNALGQQIR